MELIKFAYYMLIVTSSLIKLVNCSNLDDIDKSDDISQIIEARGFICETHYITTGDGYILGNYRIVNPLVSQSTSTFSGQKLKPIVMQSGLLGSAVDFIINSPRGFVNSSILKSYNSLDSIDFDLDGRNLGFILANLGYDVWLTNPRGNKYSSNHTTLDPRKGKIIKIRNNLKTINYDYLDMKQFWSFSLDEMANIDLPAIIDYVLNVTDQGKLIVQIL